MRLPLEIATLLAGGTSVAGALGPGALGSADLSVRQVERTISSWREHVGRGRQLGGALASASHVRLSFRSLRVNGGSQGAAVFLDRATDAPARFLRHRRSDLDAISPVAHW